MTSLPSRLRRHPYHWVSIRHEAAQEIERLEAEIAALKAEIATLKAEIERLKKCNP